MRIGLGDFGEKLFGLLGGYRVIIRRGFWEKLTKETPHFGMYRGPGIFYYLEK